MTPEPIDLREFEAFLFDLDGVVTRTASVHATAWKRLFDDYLEGRARAGGSAFVPFDPVIDYQEYVDGRPREAGVRSFLLARGISLPPGSPDDGPEVETLNGLGKRKDQYFIQTLGQHGVEVYEGTVSFIRDARARGVRTAIVSSSQNCAAVLDAAGLTQLFDVRVDGIDLRRLGLGGKPAPDMFLEAARQLKTPPAHAAVFEDAVVGVEAGHAGRFRLVVGMGHGEHAADLRAHGADIVVDDLRELSLEQHPAMTIDTGAAAHSEKASHETHSLLAINGGSSSIRFALFDEAEPPRRLLNGKVDRVGVSGTNLTFSDSTGQSQDRRTIDPADHRSAVAFLLEWLEMQQAFASVKAVGHRVVHGMAHSEPERVSPELLDELHRITPYDPEHLALEIELIEAFRQRHPTLPQVACFDTAFHRTMPRVASLLPIPRRYQAAGVRRYGFHGLSYEFLMEELTRLGDPAATNGRVILAHLGNGASLAAVRDGKSIDTSMGFTPSAGLVMGSRSGDLDPGLVSYLARAEQMSATQFQEMVNHESGLLGVSEISSDVRDLLAREANDVRAAEAVALFCYQAKKWIGSFAAALGGLDTIVFAGGIGENAPLIRERICDALGFLGIELNAGRNSKNASLISTDTGRVAVRVIRTDEELMIARSVVRVLGFGLRK